VHCCTQCIPSAVQLAVQDSIGRQDFLCVQHLAQPHPCSSWSGADAVSRGCVVKASPVVVCPVCVLALMQRRLMASTCVTCGSLALA
jgi:hypothetical protein